MNDFLLFFISVIFILIIIKKVFIKDNLIKVKSSIDNKEYIVRDLPNSVKAANKISIINSNILLLIDNLDQNKESVIRLKKNYKSNSLMENTENSEHTSYTLNKGEKIAICLREKDKDIIFEDDNTIMFVVIHELAHLMTESIGHTKEFWNNMRYLLNVAIDIGIYKYVDYEKNNVEYCGKDIKSSPLNNNK